MTVKEIGISPEKAAPARKKRVPKSLLLGLIVAFVAISCLLYLGSLLLTARTPANSVTAPAVTTTAQPAAVSPVPAQSEARQITTESSPCFAGQIKGDQVNRIYYLPGNTVYSLKKTNVQCFDSEAQAHAAFYRSAVRQ